MYCPHQPPRLAIVGGHGLQHGVHTA
jgi:hypothetical protein